MNALAYAIFAIVTVLAFGLGGASAFFFFRARTREGMLDTSQDAELGQHEADGRRQHPEVSSSPVHGPGSTRSQSRLETEIGRLREEVEQRDLDLNILRQDYDLETGILKQEIAQLRGRQETDRAGPDGNLSWQQAELETQRLALEEAKAELKRLYQSIRDAKAVDLAIGEEKAGLERMRLELDDEKAGLARMRLALDEERAKLDEQTRRLELERRLLAQKSGELQAVEERLRNREANLQDLQVQSNARKEDAILIERLRQQVQKREDELHRLQELLARAESDLTKLAEERQAAAHGSSAGGSSRGSSFPNFSPLSLLLDRRPSRTAAAEPHLESGDRLIEIRGIDDRLQSRLYALGITSFEQVARWSSADVRRIAERLGVDRRAIEEHWIADAQARLYDRSHTM